MSMAWNLSRLVFQNSPSSEQTSEKQSLILRCLQGHSSTPNGSASTNQQLDDDGYIDLWELRELALSHGGLVDASIRKRAWPILTSCHTAILDGTCAHHPSVLPSQSDLHSLRHDVKQTVWDITEYLQNKSQGHNQRFAEAFVSNSIVKPDPRRVTFAADKRRVMCGITNEKSEETDAVPPIRLSPTDCSDDEANEGSSSTITSSISHDRHSAVSAIGASFVSQSNGTSSSSSGRRVRWRKATKYEQKIVENVITTVLRTPAPEHASFADDRFHYYSGLHNLTAILLANLESPSLTSMVLGKLAVFHLRDAMRQDVSVSVSALDLTLFPLLQQVDPSLYNHICVRSGLLEPGFALTWVTAWFASDVGDLAVASRLIDVFLVSHPLMPVYCVVALLVSQRKRLLSSGPSLKALYANLRSLKLMATLTMSNDRTAHVQAMTQTEEIIASALRFIKQVPPQTLIHTMQNSGGASRRSAIVMLSESSTPSWCVKDICLTEWGVIQRAQSIRAGRILPEPHSSGQNNHSVKKYSNAFAAAGYKTSKKALIRFSPFDRRVLVILGLAIASLFLYPSNKISVLDWSTVRSCQATRSNPPEKQVVSIFDKLPIFRANSSDDLSDEPTSFHQFRETLVVTINLRHEDKILAPVLVHPSVYELTDSERDFERFVFKPLQVAIEKFVVAVIHRRSKVVNRDGREIMFPINQISGHVDSDAAQNVDLAKNATAVHADESFALVRYIQKSTKKTFGAHMKELKEKLVFQTKQAVKMGKRILLVSQRVKVVPQ